MDLVNTFFQQNIPISLPLIITVYKKLIGIYANKGQLSLQDLHKTLTSSVTFTTSSIFNFNLKFYLPFTFPPSSTFLPPLSSLASTSSGSTSSSLTGITVPSLNTSSSNSYYNLSPCEFFTYFFFISHLLQLNPPNFTNFDVSSEDFNTLKIILPDFFYSEKNFLKSFYGILYFYSKFFQVKFHQLDKINEDINSYLNSNSTSSLIFSPPSPLSSPQITNKSNNFSNFFNQMQQPNSQININNNIQASPYYSHDDIFYSSYNSNNSNNHNSDQNLIINNSQGMPPSHMFYNSNNYSTNLPNFPLNYNSNNINLHYNQTVNSTSGLSHMSYLSSRTPISNYQFYEKDEHIIRFLALIRKQGFDILFPYTNHDIILCLIFTIIKYKKNFINHKDLINFIIYIRNKEIFPSINSVSKTKIRSILTLLKYSQLLLTLNYQGEKPVKLYFPNHIQTFNDLRYYHDIFLKKFIKEKKIFINSFLYKEFFWPFPDNYLTLRNETNYLITHNLTQLESLQKNMESILAKLIDVVKDIDESAIASVSDDNSPDSPSDSPVPSSSTSTISQGNVSSQNINQNNNSQINQTQSTSSSTYPHNHNSTFQGNFPTSFTQNQISNSNQNYQYQQYFQNQQQFQHQQQQYVAPSPSQLNYSPNQNYFNRSNILQNSNSFQNSTPNLMHSNFNPILNDSNSSLYRAQSQSNSITNNLSGRDPRNNLFPPNNNNLFQYNSFSTYPQASFPRNSNVGQLQSQPSVPHQGPPQNQ